MKKIFLFLAFFMILKSSNAQLDSIAPAKLTAGLSIGQLISLTIPAATVFVNKRLAKRQYADAQAGFVTIFGNSTLNPQIDKIRGGRFSLAYRFQRERSIFNRTLPYIGVSLDYDYLKGEGRTTYSRANGAFFQRYAFSNTTTLYSTNLIVGFVFNIDEFLTLELGGKIGFGRSTASIISAAPKDAVINNENGFNLYSNNFNFLPQNGEDFTNIRVMLRIGYVIN